MLDREIASSHGTPVYVTVWDLSPPSKWSSAASGWLGFGIFHTNIFFPDLSVEWAFGGHGYRDVSGIISLPRDPILLDAVRERVLAVSSSDPILAEKPETLDGLSLLGPDSIPSPGPPPLSDGRYMGSYFIGYARSVDARLVSSNSVRPSTRSQSGKNAFREPTELCEPYFVRAASILAKANLPRANQPTTTLTPIESISNTTSPRHPRHRGQRLRSIGFVQQTMQNLRKDPEWMGPKYDLLTRNCNHFTDAVCRMLTGSGIPTWINRSAMLGQHVLWAVPKSILDIDTGVQLEEEVDESSPSEVPLDHGRERTLRHT